MDVNFVQICQGKHGNGSLYHVGDGYFFTAISHSNSASYLRCVEHRHGCAAKAFLNALGTFDTYNLHNHAPDHLRLSNLAERCRLLNEAANLEYATLTDVFEHHGITDQQTRRSWLPSMWRARLNAYPPPPTTLRQLNLILTQPQFRCMTATTDFGDNIYRGVSEAPDGSVVILLMTEHCRDFAKLCTCLISTTSSLMIEGAPHSYPVHVLATIWDDTTVILGWVLLERSSEGAYCAAFSHLKATLGDCQLQLILCTKDSVEETSYRSVFPSVKVNYTLLSFAQSLCGMVASRRPLNQEQLQANSDLLYRIGLICALPLIPSDFVHEAVCIIRREIMTDQLLGEVLDDLERNHLLNPLRFATFSACGSFYRTSNVNEIIDIIAEKHLKPKKNFYSLLRYMATVAETSDRDLQLIEQGLKVGMLRNAVSLSQDKEINTLTESLYQPCFSRSHSILNLLRLIVSKQQHLLPKFLK